MMKRKMGKVVLCSLLALAFLAGSGQTASAGVVGVWGERFDLNVINNFYNSLAGHTSSILGNLDNVSDVDLLWAVQPSDSYTATELSQMSGFLSQGGRIAFMGEHGSFAPAENNRIVEALTYFGSDMSIINEAPDSGFHDATKANGQILDHSLTEGVNTYNYACYAPLVIGSNAEKLMYGSDLTSVMMGYENIGDGSVFLITDQNPWDNVYSTGTNDNAVMFENLLVASTEPGPVVPVPGAFLLGSLGAGMVTWLRRRRAV